MRDLLRELKSAALPALISFLTGIAGLVLAVQEDPSGSTTVQNTTILKIAACVASILVFLISWGVRLWLRDLKRERIKFARESGRRIRTCTETGEIMIADSSRITATSKIDTCPACRREIAVHL
jgi:hypothetical protein